MQNLLFILVDSLRYDKCLSNFKPPYNLDYISYLRKNGTFCSQAVSTTSFTTPSVVSILTGVYPFFHGIEWFSGHKLNPRCLTLAELLKQRGYHTCAMVTGPLAPFVEIDRGFDDYLYRNETETIHSPFKSDVQRFLTSIKKPWFPFLHLWELHFPIFLPEASEKKYLLTKYKYDIALNYLDIQLSNVFKNVDLEDTLIILTGDHGESRVQHSESILRNLFALVPSILHIPGNQRNKFWITMRRKMNKYIPAFQEKQGHGFNINDVLIRVPLIFAGKGFPKAKIINQQVGHVDLLPTILDNLGFLHELKLNIHGRSLLPLLHDDQSLSEKPLYIGPAGIKPVRNDEELRAMKENYIEGLRTSKWKYISRYNKDEPLKLFDLEKDPLEQKNLLNSRENVVSRFREHLKKIRSNHFQPKIDMTKEEDEFIKERLMSLGYI